MKIDLTKELVHIDGKKILDAPSEEGGPQIPMTLKTAMVNALAAVDQNATGSEKLSRYNLAMKIQDSEESIDLQVEDISTIKNLVGKIFGSPILVGQVWNLLDPPAPKAVEEVPAE
jgi:hypothetical protein